MTPLTHTVAYLIMARGHEGGTANHLMPLLPSCTRRQVIRALQNAKFRGYLECDGRGPRKGRQTRGSDPGTYRWTDDCQPLPTVDLQAARREWRERQPRMRSVDKKPVRWVFDLGSSISAGG
jgi:hypothetical protein